MKTVIVLVVCTLIQWIGGQQVGSVLGDAPELLELAWGKEDTFSASRVLIDFQSQGGKPEDLVDVFKKGRYDQRYFVVTGTVKAALDTDIEELKPFFAELFSKLDSDGSGILSDLYYAAVKSQQGQPELFGEVSNNLVKSRGCGVIQTSIDEAQKKTRDASLIRSFLDSFISSFDALKACVKCFDVAPEGDQTCIERKLFGQCSESWMSSGYYCAESCNFCVATEEKLPEEPAPSPEPTPDPSPTPKPKRTRSPSPKPTPEPTPTPTPDPSSTPNPRRTRSPVPTLAPVPKAQSQVTANKNDDDDDAVVSPPSPKMRKSPRPTPSTVEILSPEIDTASLLMESPIVAEPFEKVAEPSVEAVTVDTLIQDRIVPDLMEGIESPEEEITTTKTVENEEFDAIKALVQTPPQLPQLVQAPLVEEVVSSDPILRNPGTIFPELPVPSDPILRNPLLVQSPQAEKEEVEEDEETVPAVVQLIPNIPTRPATFTLPPAAPLIETIPSLPSPAPAALTPFLLQDPTMPAIAPIVAATLSTVDLEPPMLEPVPEPEPEAADETVKAVAPQVAVRAVAVPPLVLTPEEENEADTLALSVESGTLGIVVSLLTAFGKEDKSASIAQGIIIAVNEGFQMDLAEALAQVFSDEQAFQFFKDPAILSLTQGGEVVADVIAEGLVLAIDQGEQDGVILLLNELLNEGGNVASLLDTALRNSLTLEVCEGVKEAFAMAQEAATDSQQMLAAAQLTELATADCVTSVSAPVIALEPVDEVGIVKNTKAASTVDQILAEDADVFEKQPLEEKEVQKQLLPDSTTKSSRSIIDTDTAPEIQELSKSDAVLSASVVFTEAISMYQGIDDAIAIAAAFRVLLQEGQQTQLLALIVAIYQEVEDKELLGRAFGGIAVEGGEEMLEIIAQGLTQVAVAQDCAAVGPSLLSISNMTSIMDMGGPWEKALLAQPPSLAQCLGFGIEDCGKSAADDCCLVQGGIAPQECHFCEFDIGCRYEQDNTSLESLGLLVFNDRFFSKLCKCAEII